MAGGGGGHNNCEQISWGAVKANFFNFFFNMDLIFHTRLPIEAASEFLVLGTGQ